MVIAKCPECGDISSLKYKGMCLTCYGRLRARNKKLTPEQINKRKEYVKKNRELYNKSSRENYHKNKEKRLITIIDGKRKKLKKDKCEICGLKENLEYHHIKYDRKNSIIKVLCRKCHKSKHIKIKDEIRRKTNDERNKRKI